MEEDNLKENFQLLSTKSLALLMVLKKPFQKLLLLDLDLDGLGYVFTKEEKLRFVQQLIRIIQ